MSQAGATIEYVDMDPVELLEHIESADDVVQWQRADILIEGTAPLLIYNWMEGEWRDALYTPPEEMGRIMFPSKDGGYGFPSTVFKSALVNGAGPVPGWTKPKVKGLFQIHPLGPDGLVAIRSKKAAEPFEALWLLKRNTAARCTAARLDTWEARLQVSYVGPLTVSVIENLAINAGASVGVGLCAPGKPKRGQLKDETGEYRRFGTFKVLCVEKGGGR
jgi:hypothetical protein